MWDLTLYLLVYLIDIEGAYRLESKPLIEAGGTSLSSGLRWSPDMATESLPQK